MRRIHVCFLVMSLFATAPSGCGDAKDSGAPAKSAPSRTWSADAAKDKCKDAIKDTAKDRAIDKEPSRDRDTGKELAMAEPVAAAERPARSRQEPGPQSGRLTAGNFDDNVEPAYFRAFAGKFGWQSELGDVPQRFSGRRLTINVRGSDGGPVGNARVHLTTAPGREIVLTTRSDGRAVFVAPWDALPSAPIQVTVMPPDGSTSATATVPRDAVLWEVTLPATTSTLPERLDLALVLDTTGSMGDELEFLKSEIRSIAGNVKEKFPHVDQSFGLILYRDQGDEYVTRTFNFTPSLEAFQHNLAAQRAGGGGDEPEAMHKALEDAGQLRWREGSTARVLFLITDAPPHRQHMERTMQAADVLRKKGVAIYPIACSGYRDSAELILRACALMTGSQFLFLTDDSGVGNAHGEPHIPSYHVQKLERLMIRMIAAELSGKRLEPERSEILRSVGKPIN